MHIMYARVSATDQNLDLQIEAGKKAGCEKIFEEKRSGKNMDRPEFKRMLDILRDGDVVVVYKLDRLARSTIDLLKTIQSFDQMGVGFKSLSEAWADTTTPHGRLMITIFAGLAEFEREQIRERQRDGIAEARRQGKHLGRRPKLDEYKKDLAIVLLKGGKSLGETAKMLDVSRRTIARIREEKGSEA